MRIESITVLIEPTRTTVDSIQGPVPTPRREFFEADRLADELNSLSEARVVVKEGFLREAPQEGIIFLIPSSGLAKSLAECEVELRETLPERVVLVGADRADIFDLLDKYSLAAAIEEHSYFLWKVGSKEGRGLYGLHGLVSVAENIDATVLLRSGRYCLLRKEPFRGLSELLIQYLETYVRLQMPPGD